MRVSARRAIVGLAVLLVFAGVQAWAHQYTGSGKRSSESRTVPAFRTVESTGSIDVEVRVGGEQSVVVEGDDNLLALVETEVKDDALIVRTRDSYRSKTGLGVKISTPVLEGFSLSGSGAAEIDGVKTADFKLTVSGSGDVTARGTADTIKIRISGSGDLSFSDVQAKSVSVRITGSGDVRLRGETDELEASVTGSGDVNCSDLRARIVTAEITGSGDVNVLASESLQADISGSGDVTYGGSPAQVRARSTGSGEVLKR